MIERIDRKPRTFADELAIERFAFFDIAAIQCLPPGDVRCATQVVATLAESPTIEPTTALDSLDARIHVDLRCPSDARRSRAPSFRPQHTDCPDVHRVPF